MNPTLYYPGIGLAILGLFLVGVSTRIATRALQIAGVASVTLGACVILAAVVVS